MKSLSAAFSVGSPPSRSKYAEQHTTLWPDVGSGSKKRSREEHLTPSITPDRNIKVKFLRPKAVYNFKIFNDPIHESIEFDEMCLRIIDTVEFKRLRGLKQLGVCDHVFMSATHTRFEHSLGVAHLAGKVAKCLRNNQPHLGISDSDIKCLQIAGLCHDLGHGPYSHVFDGVFIKRMHPEGINKDGKKWRHEEGSVLMFRQLLKQNNIFLEDYELDDIDLKFVEEIIGGVEGSARVGRGADKKFLYDIVNNTRSGLDVDKIDYFLRDSASTNVSAANISVDRLFQNCRVFPTEEPELMICYPEKMVKEAMDFFAVRFNMHQSVYTHKCVKAVEFMLTDALVLANDHIFITGSITPKYPTGRYKMSECIDDMTALSQLKDSVVDIIRHDPNPLLQKSKDIFRRIDERQLYSCIGKTSFTRENQIFGMTESEIEKALLSQQGPRIAFNASSGTGAGGEIYHRSHHEALDFVGEEEEIDENDGNFCDTPDSLFRLSHAGRYSRLRGDESCGARGQEFEFSHQMSMCSQDSVLSAIGFSDPVLEPGDIIVEKMHIHYGMKDKNPLNRMRFFAKDDPDCGKLIEEKVYVGCMPRSFEEMNVRVFCKDPAKKRVARKVFELWSKILEVPLPFPTCSQGNETPRKTFPRPSQQSP